MHLTEHIILARSRKTSLASIKRLNVWGCELTDISVLEKLPNIEVLALSVNKISSLKSLQNSQRLQELHLRNNNIQDFNELIYLQNTPIKHLVLSDNPCCEHHPTENYRLSVIRLLPNLRTLDDVEVTQDELNQALNSMDSRNQFNRHMQPQDFPHQPTPRPNMEMYPREPNSDNNHWSPGVNQWQQAQQTSPHLKQCQPSRPLAPPTPQSMKKPSMSFCQSQIGLAEWEKRRGETSSLNDSGRVSQSLWRGSVSERGVYPTNGGRRGDHCAPSSVSRGGTPRRMNPHSVDSISNASSPASSILSTNRSSSICPRSRRVNLLCATLRFVLELDLLDLVDVLSTIRYRIEELCVQ